MPNYQKYSPSSYLIPTLIHIYNYVNSLYIYIWLEVIMSEIQNESVFIFFYMTLFITTWSDGWIVKMLLVTMETQGSIFSCDTCPCVKIYKLTYMLKKGLQVVYMPRGGWPTFMPKRPTSKPRFYILMNCNLLNIVFFF